MDCEGCERKVRRSVEGMKGVSSVDINPKQHKLTVVGYVDPDKVVARVAHRTGKKAELWPYVPYDVVDHPYAPGVYDKKAPAGYVRNTEYVDQRTSQLARASSTEVRYTTAFSDENPQACAIMWSSAVQCKTLYVIVLSCFALVVFVLEQKNEVFLDLM